MCCCISNDVFLRKIDFDGSSTSYTNKLMKGRRFRLVLDRNMILEEGVEWECKPAGGFDLLTFQMSDDNVIVVQFY